VKKFRGSEASVIPSEARNPYLGHDRSEAGRNERLCVIYSLSYSHC
jgi:hypothetical protein